MTATGRSASNEGDSGAAPRGAPPAGDEAAERALGPFHRGAALVSAACAALRALPDPLAAVADLLRAPTPSPDGLAGAVRAVRSVVEARATHEGRNLLVRRRGDAAGFLVFGLVRQRSGAMGVQPIEIDLAAIALVAPEDGVLDGLEAALDAPRGPDSALMGERAAALRARVDAATSRLSVVKARLDVQTSFLGAMFATGGAAPPAHLASDLDQARARTLALDMRSLLGGRGLTSGDSGQAAVRGLFGTRRGG